MSLLQLTTDVQDGLAVLSLTGELDLAGASQLEAELQRLVEAGTPAIVVDLSALEFMDSTGLRSLVLADRRLTTGGHRFALVPGTESVRRVFEITRMDRRLRFVEEPRDVLREDEATA